MRWISSKRISAVPSPKKTTSIYAWVRFTQMLKMFISLTEDLEKPDEKFSQSCTAFRGGCSQWKDCEQGVEFKARKAVYDEHSRRMPSGHYPGGRKWKEVTFHLVGDDQALQLKSRGRPPAAHFRQLHDSFARTPAIHLFWWFSCAKMWQHAGSYFVQRGPQTTLDSYRPNSLCSGCSLPFILILKQWNPMVLLYCKQMPINMIFQLHFI